MRDPDTGQRLAPGVFIPATERFQLGVQLDRHVIELALGWREARPDAAAQVHLCAIKLTAASIVDENFQHFLPDRVLHSPLPASILCFEITKTSAVRDPARAQTLISQLRALGCGFALNDFGTGFCSFNYLRSLGVDYFKIDRSFVRDLRDTQLSTAIVRSITDIAHVLNKKTVAEQVESEDDCELLRRRASISRRASGCTGGAAGSVFRSPCDEQPRNLIRYPTGSDRPTSLGAISRRPRPLAARGRCRGSPCRARGCSRRSSAQTPAARSAGSP